MTIFQTIVGLCGLIALTTGANDVWKGAAVKGDFGDLREHTHAPLLNFTLRFLGAIWMGFGALLIVFAIDPIRYFAPLLVAFIFVIIGGASRVLSLIKHGLPSDNKALVYQTLGVELVLIPALLIWLLLLATH